MLRTTDLMVGDWVLYDMNYGNEDISVRPNYQPSFIQNGDDINFCAETNSIGDESVYLPMPLSGDILNANFPDVSDGVFWCWDDRRSADGNEDWFEVRIEKGDDEARVCVRYVHELQHLLRLFGIEKKINVYTD